MGNGIQNKKWNKIIMKNKKCKMIKGELDTDVKMRRKYW